MPDGVLVKISYAPRRPRLCALSVCGVFAFFYCIFLRKFDSFVSVAHFECGNDAENNKNNNNNNNVPSGLVHYFVPIMLFMCVALFTRAIARCPATDTIHSSIVYACTPHSSYVCRSAVVVRWWMRFAIIILLSPAQSMRRRHENKWAPIPIYLGIHVCIASIKKHSLIEALARSAGEKMCVVPVPLMSTPLQYFQFQLKLTTLLLLGVCIRLAVYKPRKKNKTENKIAWRMPKRAQNANELTIQFINARHACW